MKAVKNLNIAEGASPFPTDKTVPVGLVGNGSLCGRTEGVCPRFVPWILTFMSYAAQAAGAFTLAHASTKVNKVPLSTRKRVRCFFGCFVIERYCLSVRLVYRILSSVVRPWQVARQSVYRVLYRYVHLSFLEGKGWFIVF